MRAKLHRYTQLFDIHKRGRWALVVGLGLTMSGLEAGSALLVYLLLSLATGSTTSTDLPLVGDLRQRLPGASEQSTLLWVAGVVAGFFVIRAVVMLLRVYAESRVTENAGARLSHRLFQGYLAVPYAFHLQQNSAESIRNVYATVNNVITDVLRPSLKLVSEGLITLGLLVVLVSTAPLATMLVLVILAPVALMLMRLVHPRLRLIGRGAQDAAKDSIKIVQQSLEGIRDIKILGREGYFEAQYRRARGRLSRIKYQKAVLVQAPAVGLETVMVLSVALLFGVAIIVEGDAVDAIPILGLFGYAAFRLRPSVNVIIGAVNSLRFSGAGMEDISKEIAIFEALPEQSDQDDGEVLTFHEAITLNGVGFQYEEASSPALQSVDLRIARGEAIGIVGPTGGGKTTLLNLIIGLLQPTAGSILVDGRDVAGNIAAWQRNIGMVPQELFLLDDTLRRNIALGVEDHLIDESRLSEAISLAQLDAVVHELPGGLNCELGERGVRLSGGQRQRVAIARALYRRPHMLAFDEGTSSLDNSTEREVIGAIERLRGQLTLITIAHRLSTVRNSDRIVLIEDGQISDVGSYTELEARNPRFQRMAR